MGVSKTSSMPDENAKITVAPIITAYTALPEAATAGISGISANDSNPVIVRLTAKIAILRYAILSISTVRITSAASCEKKFTPTRTPSCHIPNP